LGAGNEGSMACWTLDDVQRSQLEEWAAQNGMLPHDGNSAGYNMILLMMTPR
jgi:hypothetical protein